VRVDDFEARIDERTSRRTRPLRGGIDQIRNVAERSAPRCPRATISKAGLAR